MFRGIALKLASTLAFIAMSTQVKLVADGYPLGEVIFFRAFFAMIPLLIWLGMRGELMSSIVDTKPRNHIRRCMAGATGMFFSFGALTNLPLPDATAISYVTPILTTAFAAIFLHETVRGYRWTAVFVGFCGMLVMVSPHLSSLTSPDSHSDLSALGASLGLGGAICSAFATLEVRKLSQAERTGSIVFYFTLTTSLASGATALFGWTLPDWHDGLLLVGSGIMGGVGQILLTSSYRHADVSVIAPFDYCSLLWALVIGYFMFGDLPNPVVLSGAAIVIVAGVTVIIRERQLGLKLQAERESGHHRNT